MRKGALGEAERDLWTQETGEDRREAGSETKPEENARKAQPQTRKHRLQQPPERRRAQPGPAWHISIHAPSEEHAP